jgi:hypothetical protein
MQLGACPSAYNLGSGNVEDDEAKKTRVDAAVNMTDIYVYTCTLIRCRNSMRTYVYTYIRIYAYARTSLQ